MSDENKVENAENQNAESQNDESKNVENAEKQTEAKEDGYGARLKKTIIDKFGEDSPFLNIMGRHGDNVSKKVEESVEEENPENTDPENPEKTPDPENPDSSEGKLAEDDMLVETVVNGKKVKKTVAEIKKHAQLDAAIDHKENALLKQKVEQKELEAKLAELEARIGRIGTEEEPKEEPEPEITYAEVVEAMQTQSAEEAQEVFRKYEEQQEKKILEKIQPQNQPLTEDQVAKAIDEGISQERLISDARVEEQAVQDKLLSDHADVFSNKSLSENAQKTINDLAKDHVGKLVIDELVKNGVNPNDLNNMTVREMMVDVAYNNIHPKWKDKFRPLSEIVEEGMQNARNAITELGIQLEPVKQSETDDSRANRKEQTQQTGARSSSEQVKETDESKPKKRTVSEIVKEQNNFFNERSRLHQ